MFSILFGFILVSSYGLQVIDSFAVECSDSLDKESIMRMMPIEKRRSEDSVITNCIELLAYYQSLGQDPVEWCGHASNYHVCCLTCQNYQQLSSSGCVDVASTYDCQLKKEQGQCDAILGNNQPVYFFCAKTCGRCPNRPRCLSCPTLSPNNCQMGGRCFGVSVFNTPTVRCLCPSSRGGTYCQISNPCNSNPCLNGGSCTPEYESPVGSYTCQCAPGFSGSQCQIFNQCYSIYCLNGGYCKLNYVGVPYCYCPPGFFGSYCENSVGTCSPNPCQNNGQCLPTSNNDFKCLCPPNFSGKTCNYYVAPALCHRGDVDETHCRHWKNNQLCDFIYVYQGAPIPLYCPQSCGICKGYPSCIDRNPNCPTWANFGLCDHLKDTYPEMCRKSCNCCS